MANFNYAQFSFNNNMMCYIQDGIIYQVVDFQNATPIGVTNDKFDEALTKAEKYYNRLVELGDIVPPKTQEEINQELTQTNLQLIEIVKQLQAQVTELKEEKANEHSNDSESVGTRPKSSKPSAKPKQEL